LFWQSNFTATKQFVLINHARSAMQKRGFDDELRLSVCLSVRLSALNKLKYGLTLSYQHPNTVDRYSPYQALACIDFFSQKVRGQNQTRLD